jgi:hypothetical protein
VTLTTLGGLGHAAPKDARAGAEAALAAVKASPDAAIAREPVENAQGALRRARAVLDTGDRNRATLLERLALEWAGLAADLLRTAKAERRAEEAQQKLSEIKTRTVRARALLEETVARRGRSRAELDAAERPAPSPTEPAKPPSGAAPLAPAPGKAP